MRRLLLFICFIPFFGISQEFCSIYGKIKIVDSFEDVKILKVDSFSDQEGRWELVDSFEDYKIKFVDSFEDFTIKFVDSFEGCD